LRRALVPDVGRLLCRRNHGACEDHGADDAVGKASGETGVKTLPALLVLAVTGTTAGADTAVMRPPPVGVEQIMDAKRVMRLDAIVRSTGFACQEGIFVAYKLPREADAQRFEVMCLGNGALSDQRMRHYMLQIQDDASLAVGSRP